MSTVLVSVLVGVVVSRLVGVSLKVVVGRLVGVVVAVGVRVLVGVTDKVSVIPSVGRVLVNLPLQLTGLMLPGRPLAGTANAKPVRNTRPVSVTGTEVSQRLFAASKLVVVKEMVGEKLTEAPGTFKL